VKHNPLQILRSGPAKCYRSIDSAGRTEARCPLPAHSNCR
jgi:hypothetical protein